MTEKFLWYSHIYNRVGPGAMYNYNTFGCENVIGFRKDKIIIHIIRIAGPINRFPRGCSRYVPLQKFLVPIPNNDQSTLPPNNYQKEFMINVFSLPVTNESWKLHNIHIQMEMIVAAHLTSAFSASSFFWSKFPKLFTSFKYLNDLRRCRVSTELYNHHSY